MISPEHRRSARTCRFLRLAAALLLVFVPDIATKQVMGHGPHEPPAVATDPTADSRPARIAEEYRKLFARLVARWPTPLQESLIEQAWKEHQFSHGLYAGTVSDLQIERAQRIEQLRARLPSTHIAWTGTGAARTQSTDPLSLCRSIESPLLVTIENQTKMDVTLRIAPGVPFASQAEQAAVLVPAGSQMVVLTSVLAAEDLRASSLPITLTDDASSITREVSIPVRLRDPATIDGTVQQDGKSVPARITVTCSDGVCRHRGQFANKSTFTDKPIIFPPIGGWRKTSFFYTDGSFQMAVPPGPTRVDAERGFERERASVHVNATSGETRNVELSCNLMVDLPRLGWISGDTHVHWVTNQWNVDEPLELLAMAQRAEGLRVANNLTLLQRRANQAFIKPSQAPMGVIAKFSNRDFHMQMGEEYRNENLYGHHCFLNIDWLVQPIGTGSIIAGPDALDYPLNRTAIEACRRQGGISIEAHGTGGNKDVPANVIHNLTDSLDQMEPEMYYRLLDCAFRLPLTNGSDHPARTLGTARVYAKIHDDFTYDRWIEAIRSGRTFTSSGPLIFLQVNGAEIGDVVASGEREILEITANVGSRDPIGRVQIVSNGQVIAEKETQDLRTEISVRIPAEQSRWIVARCTNRSDGRANFGFGDFNAITGPGVAHTSPIYVEVDGRPRFDPQAVAYWRDRLRTHLHDVRAKGRFATKHQLQEAVDYLQDAIEMFTDLESHIDSARAREESWSDANQRLANVIRRFGGSRSALAAIAQLEIAELPTQRSRALESLVALSVSVNPESRVKVNARKSKLELHQGRPQRFLIEVQNTAGTTAPLNLTAVDVATDPPAAADWCTLEIVDSPFTSRFFSGAETEYKVMQITPHVAGLREVRIIGDAGQGTQDLGFRASTDVLLEISAKRMNSYERP